MIERFRDRLRKAMEMREVTASELSRRSGVGKSDICYYLKGHYLPKQDKIYLMAKALDVDPGWLFTGVEQKHEEGEVPLTSEARILAAGIDKLPKEQREQALNVIKAMFAKYSSYFEEGSQTDETEL